MSPSVGCSTASHPSFWMARCLFFSSFPLVWHWLHGHLKGSQTTLRVPLNFHSNYAYYSKSFFFSSHPHRAFERCGHLLDLLKMGILVSFGKSNLISSQDVEYLGAVFHLSTHPLPSLVKGRFQVPHLGYHALLTVFPSLSGMLDGS